MIRFRPTRNPSSALLALGCIAACGPSEWPVVAAGRYVEVAKVRDDIVCAGTVDAMDQYIAGVFEAIGAQPPDGIFVRYQWREYNPDSNVSNNSAHPGGPGTIVDAEVLLSEHELAHAVRQNTWPISPPFMEEGFAVMFDDSGFTAGHPEGLEIDDLIDGFTKASYSNAWFVTSQVVADHGFEGLRDFWFAAGRDDSAPEIRAAYEDLFGQSIDVLTEPVDGARRFPCGFTVCGEPIAWDFARTELAPPGGCEEDPFAIGPTDTGNDIIMRRYVVPLEESESYSFTVNGELGVAYKPCGLNCQSRGQTEPIAGPGETVDLATQPFTSYRLDVFTIGSDVGNANVEIVRIDQ